MKMNNLEALKQVADMTGKRCVATYPYHPNADYLHIYIESEDELDLETWDKVQDFVFDVKSESQIWVMQVEKVRRDFNHDPDADYAGLTTKPVTIGESNSNAKDHHHG